MTRIIANILRLSMLLCFSAISVNSFARCEDAVRTFYVSYMRNVAVCDNAANLALKQAHMSPELIAKVDGYTQQYDADAIIHAQDVNDYAIESLTVIPMSDDGYMVKYKWSPDATYTMISLRACEIDGWMHILDIFPVGTDNHGNSYIKK